MKEEVFRINVEQGEFPFPIIDGPVESRYLTWLRNNANYMAVRGFLDYMRAIGVLLRGIVINFVVLLPFALLMSFAIALWYQLADPYLLTFSMLILATAVVLLYPLLTPLWNIFRHRRRLDTGSDSSVKPRSRLEQLFGILLLTVLGVTAFEFLAAFLEPFHKLVYESNMNWKEFLSIMSVALAIFASTDKLLAALGGIARNLAMIAIGILGVLMPLFFIMLVSDYLVFNPPKWSDINLITLVIPIVMILTTVIANFMLTIGWIRSISSKKSHVFTFRDVSKMSLFSIMLLVVFVVLGLAFLKGDEINADFLTSTDSFLIDIKTSRQSPTDSFLVDEKDPENEINQSKNEAIDNFFSGIRDKIRSRKNNAANLSRDKKKEIDENLQKLFADAEKRPYPPKLRQLFNRLGEIPKTGNSINTGLNAVPLLRLLELKDMSALAKSVVDVKPAITNWRPTTIDAWKRDMQFYLKDDLNELAEDTSEHFPNVSLLQAYSNTIDVETYPLEDEFSKPGYKFFNNFGAAYRELTSNAIDLKEDYPHFFNTPAATDIRGKSFYLNKLAEDTREHFPNVSLLQAYDNTIDFGTYRLEDEFSKPGYEFFNNFDAAYRELTLNAIYLKEDYPHLFNTPAAIDIRGKSFYLNATLLLMFAVPLWLITRYTVDINMTSIHGLYRDRLASAFLVGADTKGDVDIEKDLDLGEICRYEAGSTAPYHLINVALNLQGSKLMGVRDRQSDFFVFSKKFIGGFRTGYCRGETMELFFPQMGLSTAMAISAAAASPNMGRATSPALVVIMTLFNIRLGYWLPNPNRLESWLHKRKGAGGREGGYVFKDVFEEELIEVSRRWGQTYENPERYQLSEKQPTIAHSLVGVGFSGGGIRSATLNLGITQALHKKGVFKHIDYMSTVSGGGYLGSSISALMRQKTKTESETSGTVDISQSDSGEIVVSVTPEKGIFSFLRKSQEDPQPHIYEYADYANLAVKQDDKVRKGQRLLDPNEAVDANNLSFSSYYRWRVRPSALLREIAGKLNEKSKWVNVSDGGHIENLAGIELLRRRCKYIVIGDGEADPEHHFNGLAILIQTARIDLGIHIEINVDPLRLNKKGLSKAHWVAGRIHYPGDAEKGYLLYIKSSVTGDEDEVIKRYRNTQPAFPHESTADQFFGEGQFEAYRSLGQHIGESLFETAVKDNQSETAGHQSVQAASDAESSNSHEKMSFADFEQWFEMLASEQNS